ncbi:unnamed protein product [Prunus armeniaca]
MFPIFTNRSASPSPSPQFFLPQLYLLQAHSYNVQAQPPLPAPASIPFASYDSIPSNPATTGAVFAPPPSLPPMSSLVPPGLPSPPRPASSPVSLPASSPSHFFGMYSKDPHCNIVFSSIVPVSSGTSSLPSSDTSLVSVSNTHLMATPAKTSVCKPNPHHMLVSTNDTIEPTFFSQANKLKEWRLATADEFNALLHAGT